MEFKSSINTTILSRRMGWFLFTHTSMCMQVLQVAEHSNNTITMGAELARSNFSGNTELAIMCLVRKYFFVINISSTSHRS